MFDVISFAERRAAFAESVLVTASVSRRSSTSAGISRGSMGTGHAMASVPAAEAATNESEWRRAGELCAIV